MRKIESQINQAISKEKNFSGGNTTVTNENGVTTVLLHGNKIAEVTDTSITLYDGGYQSNTTKSHLNAILQGHGNGERIFQQDYVWYITIGGKKVEFESGMVLN